MAHFAEIDENNIVLRVTVVSNDDAPGELPDSEIAGQKFIASLGIPGTWIQTSYNGNFRGTYAGPGFTWDPIAELFIEPENNE